MLLTGPPEKARQRACPAETRRLLGSVGRDSMAWAQLALGGVWLSWGLAGCGRVSGQLSRVGDEVGLGVRGCVLRSPQ